MTQISDASDKIFDAAESTNERAHEATKSLVTRIQDTDLPFADRFAKVEVPFADRLSKVEIPFIDRLPEPIEAVDAYFDFVATGIETNRNIAEKLVNRFGDSAEVVETKAADVAKKAPAKKATAKKSTAKKA
jgi:hypothetical protein